MRFDTEKPGINISEHSVDVDLSERPTDDILVLAVELGRVAAEMHLDISVDFYGTATRHAANLAVRRAVNSEPLSHVNVLSEQDARQIDDTTPALPRKRGRWAKGRD